MTPEIPPVTALAQFFDDIRMEATGKAILIGQYVGDMILPAGAPPADRLAILLTARWPHDYAPKNMGVKLNIPGQPPINQPFPEEPKPAFSDQPSSPFAGIVMQAVLNLRFPPLRVGDTIDVWLLVDGHEFPAGRLSVVEQPRASILAPGDALGMQIAVAG